MLGTTLENVSASKATGQKHDQRAYCIDGCGAAVYCPGKFLVENIPFAYVMAYKTIFSHHVENVLWERLAGCCLSSSWTPRDMVFRTAISRR